VLCYNKLGKLGSGPLKANEAVRLWVRVIGFFFWLLKTPRAVSRHKAGFTDPHLHSVHSPGCVSSLSPSIIPPPLRPERP
jgi:hypothetical protein